MWAICSEAEQRYAPENNIYVENLPRLANLKEHFVLSPTIILFEKFHISQCSRQNFSSRN